jgi:membrane protease YdiL (CAAX protease family)
MAIIIPFLIVLGLSVVANLVTADRSKSTTNIFDLALAALNIPLLLIGVLFFMVPPEFTAFLVANDIPALHMDAAGWVLIAISLYAIIVCVRPVRRLLARLLPLDPDSAVHTLALVLAGYLTGNTLFALTQDVLLELVAEGVTVTILDIILQQIAFVIVAFFGAGFLTRRNLKQVSLRLGLERPTANQLLLGLATIGLLIVLQWVIGGAWALLDPEQAEVLGDLNESLLAGFDSVGEWLILAIASGVGEEILFRGALQPVFGIFFTSILFAIVHVQYGLTPITLAVFLLGIILGILRRRTNTTVTIFVHFGYNFILGLFALLAVYLQDLVG